jgi:hypothetical protein
VNLSCSPAVFQLGVTIECTATVTSPSSGIAPSGQVGFASNPDGSFAPDACTLSGVGKCSVSFTPLGAATGFYTVTASYSGDQLSYGSSNSITLIVAPVQATTVACFPNTIAINATTYCVVTVNNSQDLPIPTGSVIFSSNRSGAFDQTGCNLDPSGNCSVHYTPGVGSDGVNMITTTYSGDSYHANNTATVQLTVT